MAPGDVHLQQLTGAPDKVVAITNGLSALSGDGGRTWTKVSLPGPNHGIQPGGIAFNRSDPTKVVVLALDAADHSQVFTSKDSGRTWARSSTVPNTLEGMVSYDGHSIAFTAGRLEVSKDDGQHFTRYAVGYDGYFLDSAGVLGPSVWVTGYVNESLSGGQVLVAHSADGGRTWSQQLLSGLGLDPYDQAVPDVLPLSATEALLAMNTGALWRTADAGRTWHQERPRLPVS